MDQLNILFVTERYPPLGGGMAESAQRYVEGLRKNGHAVDLFWFARQVGPVALVKRPRDGGEEFEIRHENSIGNAAQRAWREVERNHQRAPYDLVVGFGINTPGHIATTWAAWLTLPCVALIRGNDFDRDWFDPKLHALVESTLRRATAVGAVTREKVSKVQALFPEKTTQWTPNGIEQANWELLPAEQERTASLRKEISPDGLPIVGVFGELKYKKRIPLWLEGVRDKELLDRFTLLLVGRMDQELHALLEEGSLVPRWRHLSFRDKDQLPALYHCCDFIALPSLFEGFPNVLLEAMSCGVIPICSKAGAMGEVLKEGQTAFLFDREDRAGAGLATQRALALTRDAEAAMKKRVKDEVAAQFNPGIERKRLEQLLFTAKRAH